MTEKLIKLTADEMVKLENVFRKAKQSVTRNAAGLAIGILIFSLIPTGILDFFSSSDHKSTGDPKKNIIQQWGIVGWLIFFVLVNALCTFLFILNKKIYKLKKDLADGEKREMDVVVVSKSADNENKNYFMRVSSDTLKKQKIVLEPEQYNQFTEGQKLTIDVYKNSLIMLPNK